MCPFSVVEFNPCVAFTLQLIDAVEHRLAKCHVVELMQNGAVKAFANAIRLRRLCFGVRVFDIVDGELQLIVMLLGATTVFGATFGENAQHWQAVLCEHR